jgi:hypothetical protein
LRAGGQGAAVSNQSAPKLELELEPFFNITHEPLLLHPPGRGGRIMLCTSFPPQSPRPGEKGKKKPARPWHQELVDVGQFAARLATLRLQMRDDCSYYISQNTLAPGATAREADDHQWLNALWIDIDLVGTGDWLPSRARDIAMPLSDAPEALAALLIEHLRVLGLPEPSWVTASGCGLHAKWLLSESLLATPKAVTRWELVERQLIEAVAAREFVEDGRPRRWPVDRSACDRARVLRLVGTLNHKSGTGCRVLRVGQRVQFDQLAEAVGHAASKLDGLTMIVAARAAVQSAVEAAEATEQLDIRNREAHQLEVALAPKEPARDRGKRGKRKHVAPMTADQVVALWTHRSTYGRAIIRSRGGAPEHCRNKWFWPLALAAAWISHGDAKRLHARLASLHHELFAGGAEPWTPEEARASAWSVVKRLGDSRQYKMTQKKWEAHLDVTAAERAVHWRLMAGGVHPNAGARGYEKLPAGVPLREHVARTRARQRDVARGSTAMSLQRRRGVDTRTWAEQKCTAYGWWVQGETPTRIARALGLPRQTVEGWRSEWQHSEVWMAWAHAEGDTVRQREQLLAEAKERRSAEVRERLASEARGKGK